MSLTHRHFLRDKETRATLDEIQRTIPSLDLSRLKESKIEVANLTSESQIILIDCKPAFLKTEKGLLPTLTNTSVLQTIPTITVDAGAVPHICNGSDLMAPGIVKITGDFPTEAIVAVAEQTYGKRIAIVQALVDSKTMATTKRGKVATALHYVGDKTWDGYKNLT